MPQKRKLQVFVSSTFEDLRNDRQAAVEAILKAGHIPAGMELFTAGDESQMNVIKRWIDESDVYLLILGGRYGSIEPKTEKSYTHLEYEYALEQKKLLFAVVITKDYLESRVHDKGSRVLEMDHPQKLADFRGLVTSNMVEFWGSPDQLKLAVVSKLLEYNADETLKGWVRADEAANSMALADALAKVVDDNADLRRRLEGLQAPSAPMPQINVGLSLTSGRHNWYETFGGGGDVALGVFPQPERTEERPRNGFYLSLNVSNSGTLATDIVVQAKFNASIIDSEDVTSFGKWRDVERAALLFDGWRKMDYTDRGLRILLCKGNVRTLKPGQEHTFIIPLSGIGSLTDLKEEVVDVEVFPTTGRHIVKAFSLTDLVAAWGNRTIPT